MHIINDDIQRKNATYLPAQSPTHKINDKNTTLTYSICSSSQLLIKSMLKYLKKNLKESQCFSNLRTKSMIKYTSYKNLRNLLRQLLSCKISYKIQLKNLKYLSPQSLACEVYRKQENEVKDLLPQSRRTRKINDKMQERLVKSLFSQSLLRQINDKMQKEVDRPTRLLQFVEFVHLPFSFRSLDLFVASLLFMKGTSFRVIRRK